VGSIKVDRPASRCSITHLSLYSHDTSECWPTYPSRWRFLLLKSSLLRSSVLVKVDHRFSDALDIGGVVGKMVKRLGNCSIIVSVWTRN
jgi:hypothetical protein